MKRLRDLLVRVPTFVWLSYRAGLPVVGSVAGAVVLTLFGFGLIAFARFVLDQDPFLVLVVAYWILLVTFFVGAFRIWDAADRATVKVPSSDGRAHRELSNKLKLHLAIKDGIKLVTTLSVDNLGSRISATQAHGWNSRVIEILNAERESLAMRFIDDAPALPHSTPLVPPYGVKKALEQRVALAQKIFDELDAAD